MDTRPIFATLLAFLLTGAAMPQDATAQERATPLEPPVARKLPHIETLHGER